MKVIKRAPRTTTLDHSSGHVGRARRGLGRRASKEVPALSVSRVRRSPWGDGKGERERSDPWARPQAKPRAARLPTRPTAQTYVTPRAVTVCAATRSKPSPTAGAARPPTYQGAAANPARRTPPHEVTARRGNTERRTTKRRLGTAPRQFRNNRPFCGEAARPPGRGAERQIGAEPRELNKAQEYSPALFRKMPILRFWRGGEASAGAAWIEPHFHPRAVLRRRIRGRGEAAAARRGAEPAPRGR